MPTPMSSRVGARTERTGSARLSWGASVIGEARQRLVGDAVRLVRVAAEAPVPLGFVVAEVPLEQTHDGLTLEREHVGGDPVQEPPVVADHDRTPGKAEQGLLQGSERVDVEVVRRLVQQQHVPAAFQDLGELHPVALATGELTDLLLLVAAPEAEARHVCTGVQLAVADDDPLHPSGDLVEDRRIRVQRIAGLLDLGELHRRADRQSPGVRLVLADDHAEQRRLAGAVGPDHPDDAARGEEERKLVDQASGRRTPSRACPRRRPGPRAGGRAGWRSRACRGGSRPPRLRRPARCRR